MATPATKMVEAYLIMAQKRTKKPMRPGTAGRVRRVLLKFLRDTEIGDARDITLAAIQAWIARLNRNSPDTRHGYARALHTFVGYLIRQQVVRIDLHKFEIPERAAVGRKNWLKLDVANRVIADAKDQDLAFILYCGFHAGLRKSEIIAAKVNWFDLGDGLLHVQNDPGSGFILKDADNRVIPLSPDFKEFLTSYLARRDPDSYALRPGDKGGKAEYRYDFRKVLRSHFNRCGVKCTTHDMRRSFASNLVSLSTSVYKVARWLGDGVAVVEKSHGNLAPADRDIDVLSTPARSPGSSTTSKAFADGAL